MSALKAAKARKDELKKGKATIELFDELLAKHYAMPAATETAEMRKLMAKRGQRPVGTNRRERLTDDVRSTINKLHRSRQALIEMLKGFVKESDEKREMVEQKEQIELRMEQHLQFEQDLKRTPHSTRALTEAVALTPEQQESADALAFLTSSIDRLQQQVEISSATVERARARNQRRLAEGEPEDEEDNERAERVQELNDEREWHAARLEKVERMLLNEEANAGEILALKEFLQPFLEADEDEGFEADATLYHPFGLDLPAPKEDEEPSSPVVQPTVIANRPRQPNASAGARRDDGPSTAAKDGNGADARPPPTMVELVPEQLKRRQTSADKGKAAGEKKRGFNHRTALCRSFAKSQACSFGNRCTYRHSLPGSDEDVRDAEEMGRIPCKYLFEHGHCYRSDCHFSHGDEPGSNSASLLKVIEQKHPTFGVADVDAPPDPPAVAKSASPARPVEQKHAQDSAPPKTATLAQIAKVSAWQPQQQPTALARPPQPAAPSPSATPSAPAAPATSVIGSAVAPAAPRPLAPMQAPPASPAPALATAEPSPASAPVRAPSPLVQSARASTASLASGSASAPPPGPSAPVAPSAPPSPPRPTAAAVEDDTSASASRVTGSQSSRRSVSSRASDASSVSINHSPFTPASISPVQPVARLPGGLLPLGYNACLNHMFRGLCLNGQDCLSRHVINTDDVAVGLLPLLGPGACLNHFASICANGSACLSRHALAEEDYFSSPAGSAAGASGKDAQPDRAVGRPSPTGFNGGPPPGLAQDMSVAVDSPGAQAAQPVQQNPGPIAVNSRRAFTDPRMKDPRFRDRCCRFYLVGTCPYDGFCFDIHPKGPFDLIEHAEDQTTFFIPDEDQSDGE